MSLKNRQRRWSAGFTLIELLVVVFLIGLISGFALLSISSLGDDREIEWQLKRLQYQLKLASEDAVIQGRPIGVQFDEGRYLFLIAGRSQWLELENNKALRVQDLLQDWKFELRLSGKKIPLVKTVDGDSQAKLTPQIIFFSSGEVEPFELLIVDLDNTLKFRISYGEDGVIALMSMGEG